MASSDPEKASVYAALLWSADETFKPFVEPWPADVVESDGLFLGIRVIRYAEVEAERLLKRGGAGVQAVADSLFTREDHRLIGRELDDLLRLHGGPPSPLTP